MPPPLRENEYFPAYLARDGGAMGEKKMGRPTTNPRTEKIGFRLSPQEIEDIGKCAEAMGTQRANAVVEGIKLLKKKLEIE